MKKQFFLIIILMLCVSCKKESNINTNTPHPSPVVTIDDKAEIINSPFELPAITQTPTVLPLPTHKLDIGEKKDMRDIPFIKSDDIIFGHFFVDNIYPPMTNKNGESYVSFCPSLGVRKINGKRLFVNIDSQYYKYKGNESFLIYKDQRLVGKAEMFEMPNSNSENIFYGLKFLDKSLKFEYGDYIAINSEKMACPETFNYIDEHGSFKTDLNNDDKSELIEIRPIRSEDTSSTIMMIYYNGKEVTETKIISDPDTLPEGRKRPTDIPYVLHNNGFVGVYDLDGDGKMEVIVRTAWPGGDTLEIFEFKENELQKAYASNSEEAARYYDLEGRKYYYDDYDEKVYSNDQANSSDTINKTEFNVESLIISEKLLHSAQFEMRNPIIFNAINYSDKATAKKTYKSLQGRKCEMIGSKIDNEQEFLHRIHMGLQFPSKYKETKEDTIAGLRDLSWLKLDGLIFIWEEDHLFDGDKNLKDRMISMFEEEVFPYLKDSETSLAVFLVKSATSIV